MVENRGFFVMVFLISLPLISTVSHCGYELGQLTVDRLLRLGEKMADTNG